jgi:tRNA G26 N,N-dimethylase Trm1
MDGEKRRHSDDDEAGIPVVPNRGRKQFASSEEFAHAFATDIDSLFAADEYVLMSDTLPKAFHLMKQNCSTMLQRLSTIPETVEINNVKFRIIVCIANRIPDCHKLHESLKYLFSLTICESMQDCINRQLGEIKEVCCEVNCLKSIVFGPVPSLV